MGFVFLAAIILLFPSFSNGDDSVFWPLASPEAGFIKLEKFSCSSGPYMPILPNTINEFKALGERIKEQVQPAGDYSGDSSTHTSGSFWYDGMYLGVVFINKPPYGHFLESAQFSNDHWNNLTPIKIGSSVIDFLANENISVILPPDSYLYLCNVYDSEGAPDCIKITFKGHIIIKVEYQCYTG